jgi:hypothetical protein
MARLGIALNLENLTLNTFIPQGQEKNLNALLVLEPLSILIRIRMARWCIALLTFITPQTQEKNLNALLVREP